MIKVKALNNIYLKEFFFYRFIVTSTIFNILFFFHCNSSLTAKKSSLLDFYKLTYYGPIYDTDFIGGIMWITHYIIILFFIGICIENNFHSKSIFILSRVTRLKWYISYLLFFTLVILIYLIIQFTILSGLYITFYNRFIELNDFSEMSFLFLRIILSMIIISVLYFILFLKIKLKFSFQITVTYLIVAVFFIDKLIVPYLPGMMGMIKIFELTNNYIIYTHLTYLLIIGLIGLKIVLKLNILKNTEQ